MHCELVQSGKWYQGEDITTESTGSREPLCDYLEEFLPGS